MTTHLKVHPATLQDLRDQIEHSIEGLPKQLAKIARYCLDHPQIVAMSKIGDLADGVGVHASAIVRFAQHFGFSGFTPFQALFRDSLLAGWPDYTSRITRLLSEGDQPAGVVDRFIDVSMASLIALKESIDRGRMENAISLLANSRKIYIIGLKRSFPIAFYISYVLRKLDIHSALIESNGGLLMERASWCQPEDGLLAVSFTPYASATIEVATELARRGLPIVSITDSKFSPLVPLSQEWIETTEHDWGGFRSTAATFAIAMGLAIGIAEFRGRDAQRDAAVPGINDWL
ncbi:MULTISPECIES: MurR/RpiR family transcriptional regulator [unclassified Shinella]|uniref:MurR/RpiR family transcriptional regulator n=1 Tax=unclassified Shinella TaxID=2643062 RepID=UPI00225D8D0D|nr:MurR/RpiR family transcriptional regulator [Shinella sp. YE25]MDC7260132.1 MurR/RpiR family transcriptional regulator [Shinella sp. YE25]CAI0341124.1 Predicted transcriptional regulator of the myo-inositol catabolic operon [Rhizobiaceae bacterium]CAK7262160.1 Sugar isomerase (SIS) [Shinella sp. WSC3-e]